MAIAIFLACVRAAERKHNIQAPLKKHLNMIVKKTCALQDVKKQENILECRFVRTAAQKWTEVRIMTAKKALELLNDVEFSEKYQGVQEYTEMLILCKEALEKQIPEKPVVVGEEYIFEKDEWEKDYECPFCGNPYADDCFCSCCGQKLDWSDNNA